MSLLRRVFNRAHYTVARRPRLAQAGVRSSIDPRTVLVHPRYLSLGARSGIGPYGAILCLDTDETGARFTPELSIGDDVYVGHRPWFVVAGRVRIGHSCLLANNVYIADAQHTLGDPSIPPLKRGMTPGRIEIGDRVWIGQNVSILGTVSIGEGAVIGANSVITKDVAANTIVAGTPARVLRRFDAAAQAWLPATSTPPQGDRP